MVGYEIIYGILFVMILTIKYFKGKELDRKALTMLIYGLAALVGGNLLALLVALGSATGAAVIGGLAACGSGALMVYGLWLELLGGGEPREERAPRARAAAEADVAPPTAAPAPRAPAPRPIGAAPPPRRPPPPPRAAPDDDPDA